MIVTVSLLAIYGLRYRKSLTQLCNIVVHTIHRPAAKLKSPIVHWGTSYEIWSKKAQGNARMFYHKLSLPITMFQIILVADHLLR